MIDILCDALFWVIVVLLCVGWVCSNVSVVRGQQRINQLIDDLVKHPPHSDD